MCAPGSFCFARSTALNFMPLNAGEQFHVQELADSKPASAHS